MHGISIRKLLFLIVLHIFFLTGCRQEESEPAPDSSEPSQMITMDQISISREEAESEPFSTQEAEEGFETFILENMDYFEELCFCVPYFDDIEHLDEEYFYPVLINMSVCGPLADRAESVNIEIAPYGMAKISRTDMEGYILLLFGKELPSYEPAFQEMQEGEGNFYYEDGFYYIGWFDPPDVIYTYAGCEQKENGNLLAEFVVSEAINGRSVVFELAPAENENGFIIVSKKSKTEA